MVSNLPIHIIDDGVRYVHDVKETKRQMKVERYVTA